MSTDIMKMALDNFYCSSAALEKALTNDIVEDISSYEKTWIEAYNMLKEVTEVEKENTKYFFEDYYEFVWWTKASQGSKILYYSNRDISQVEKESIMEERLEKLIAKYKKAGVSFRITYVQRKKERRIVNEYIHKKKGEKQYE